MPGRSEESPTRDISEIMRRVRSADTAPEVAFRKALWRRGLRYGLHSSHLPGCPDVVLSSRRVVVFIDGDFWHGGQWSHRGLRSLEEQFSATDSKDYWLAKIRRNMDRDCAATEALVNAGWTVLRFWESDIRTHLERCVQMTIEVASNSAIQNQAALPTARTFADFFAGIGLMRLGLERQGWRVAFANDIDPAKHAMYKAHFADADNHYLVGDVHELRPDQVPPLTLATASFPCNDLSLAGARRGLSGRQSSAFWGFVAVLNAMAERRPPLVLLENVTGFLTSHNGRDFTDALLALNDLGYSVDAFIVDAASFVPQSRPRLFVVGSQAPPGRALQVEEARQFYESELRPKALACFIFAHPQIRWTIRRLPAPPNTRRRLQDLLEDDPHGSPQWWSPDRAEYLLNQMSPRHRGAADEMIAARSWSYGTVFRRIRNGKSTAELRTDGVAGCLRTPRGGSARQILFKAGYGRYFARLLTPRECARLMGADDYSITVPLNQALFGFGDAVCVPVIEWIATHYLNPLVNELMRGVPLKRSGGGSP